MNKKMVGILILLFFFIAFVITQRNHKINHKQRKIYQLKDSVKQLQYNRNKLKSMNKKINNYNSLFNRLSKSEHCRYVDVTMYNLEESQTDNTPFITADNTNLKNVDLNTVNYVACSRDLHSKFGGILDFNDKILLLNAGRKSGIYKIKDVMNARFRRRIDIVEPQNENEYIYKDAFIIHLPDNIENNDNENLLQYKIASLYKKTNKQN